MIRLPAVMNSRRTVDRVRLANDSIRRPNSIADPSPGRLIIRRSSDVERRPPETGPMLDRADGAATDARMARHAHPSRSSSERPARPRDMTKVTKVRLRFAKCGDLRLVSHHDLMRCLERMFRRARVPMAMTRDSTRGPR